MALYTRTNYANGGIKDNTPGGWVDTNGPVWWYGSDRAYLNGYPPAGRSAITRATNLIVNKIASAEWELSDDRPHPWVTDPTNLRPNADSPSTLPFPGRIPPSVFWGDWMRSAMWWGMGYVMFRRDPYTTEPVPGSLMEIPALAVDVQPWQSGAYRAINSGNGATRLVDYDGRIEGSDYWLMELRNPTTPMDPATGATAGTLQWHAPELQLIDDQLFYATGMYSGAGVPSGYLKVSTPDFTQEDADELLEVWRNAHGSGQRGTAVLNTSTDYQAVAVTPVESAIADMKRLLFQDVANAFGVPGYLIGSSEGGSMTYSNVDMQLQAFYEFTLAPWARVVEETLSAFLPGSTRVQVTPSGERRTDGSDRAGFDRGSVGADAIAAADVPPR